MDSGSLRHIIKAVQPQIIKDAFGAPVEGAVTEVFTARCRILPVSSKEYAVGASTGTVGHLQLTMRYRPELTDKMRIVHPATGKSYEIVSIVPDGKYRSMTVRVNEVTL